MKISTSNFQVMNEIQGQKKIIDKCIFNIDSEWGSDNVWLTCQVHVTIPKCGIMLFIYYNKNYQSLFDEKLSTYIQGFHQRMKANGLKCFLPKPIFIPWEMNQSYKETEIQSINYEKDEVFIFDDVLERISSEFTLNLVNSFGNVQINFFYSLRDVYFLFSEKFIEILFKKSFESPKTDYITSKNAIFGRFITYTGKRVTLHDYSGISSSFKNLLLLLSIPHPLKDELSKDCMEKELVDHFDLFLDYAVHDVLSLSMCEKKLIEKMNYIKHSVLSIPKDETLSWSDKNTPSTVGRLVSNMFGDYIDSVFKKEENGNELLNRFRIINKKMSLTQGNLTGRKDNKIEKKDTIISDLYSGSSVDSYYHLLTNNTGIFNALTAGGRCRNEQYYDYMVESATADIDLTGCYGSSLSVFSFPIGLSTVLAFSRDDTRMSLKSFLNEYNGELVDNLYQVVVSGTLSFSQSLLYSKLISREKLKQKLDKHLIDDSDLSDGGDFVLLTHEVENCIITSDLLEILQKTCSNNEFNEILNLSVITASMYLKKDYIENLSDFIETVEKSPGEFHYVIESQTNHDNRSRAWTKIPLSGFIDPLMKERARLKIQIKDLKNLNLNQDSEQFRNISSNERFIKLLINTLYGIICSRYFEWSNTIVANNITARARGEIWMIRAALGGKQSITDGCQYCLNEVNMVGNKKMKKPGLKSLSDQRLLSKHRNITVQPLGGINWTDLFENSNTLELDSILNKLDFIALNHLENFFSSYNMKMKYNIEHKLEHTSNKMFYAKQAHYSLQTIKGKIIHKYRGIYLNEQEETPLYHRISENALNGKASELIPDPCFEYDNSKIMSVSNYLIQRNKFLKSKSSKDEILVLPGYKFTIKTFFKFTMRELPCVNKSMRLELKKKKYDVNYGLELATHSWDEVFFKRYKDYISIYTKYEEKHVKNLKKIKSQLYGRDNRMNYLHPVTTMRKSLIIKYEFHKLSYLYSQLNL